MSIVIETTIGSMTIDLFVEERPRTCLNFLKLCKIKYYNFCPFHKIVKNFIVQAGDNGSDGGESVFYFIHGENGRYYEAENRPKLKHTDFGTISMVTNDDRLIGSQFFFTLSKDIDYLDDVHTVFGKVVEGFEVLEKINEMICDKENKPYRDILITHTTILHDPFDDPEGLMIPPKSPEPSEELLNSDTIFVDEQYDENNGKTQEEIEEEIKDKEAKSKAIILEMIGDLPDADVAPPDNVLFVCKLNAVTKDEDLKMIFSRFGKVLDCEVIRDYKTGESLQYAFVEFENAKDCEQAYFKMDNVLIDDRRIHVDFSQSVAKYKWAKKSDNSNSEIRNFTENDKISKLRNRSSSRSRGKKSRSRSYSPKKSYYNSSRKNDYGIRKTNDYNFKSRDDYRSRRRDDSRSRRRDGSRSRRRDDSRSRRREDSRSRRRDDSRSRRRDGSRSRKQDDSRSRKRDDYKLNKQDEYRLSRQDDYRSRR